MIMERGGNVKPCRCLLRDAGEQDLAQAVEEYILTLDEDIKAPKELYKHRLKICESCDSLFTGTCLKCGCYVEMRAAIKTNRCPSEKSRW